MALVAVVGYGIYAGGVVAWRYFLLSNIVEDALNRELPTLTERQIPGVSLRGEPGERLARVHEGVLRGAGQADIPLGADEVTVAADGHVLMVRVRHAYPVLSSLTRQLAIAVTVERSLAVP